MSEHTKEPWRECGADRGGCICGQVWSAPLDMHVCTIIKEPEGFHALSDQQIKANAKRIVTCVNACEGVSNEWLANYAAVELSVPSEYMPIDKEINRWIDKCAELERQRDNLLGTLRQALRHSR